MTNSKNELSKMDKSKKIILRLLGFKSETFTQYFFKGVLSGVIFLFPFFTIAYFASVINNDTRELLNNLVMFLLASYWIAITYEYALRVLSTSHHIIKSKEYLLNKFFPDKKENSLNNWGKTARYVAVSLFCTVIIGFVMSIAISANSQDYKTSGMALSTQENNPHIPQKTIPKEPEITTPEPVKEAPLNYTPSDVKSWESTLANLKKIQSSWKDWDKKSDFYKDNKSSIKRINIIISQRIASIQQLLVAMKSGWQLTVAEQGMLNADSSLSDEERILADKINGKLDVSTESEDSNDDYSPIPTKSPAIVTSPPYVKTTPSVPSVPIDTNATKKQQEANCESNYISCVNSGIANQEKLLRARGMESSSEAQIVTSKVASSCKSQYRCESYP